MVSLSSVSSTSSLPFSTFILSIKRKKNRLLITQVFVRYLYCTVSYLRVWLVQSRGVWDGQIWGKGISLQVKPEGRLPPAVVGGVRGRQEWRAGRGLGQSRGLVWCCCFSHTTVTCSLWFKTDEFGNLWDDDTLTLSPLSCRLHDCWREHITTDTAATT